MKKIFIGLAFSAIVLSSCSKNELTQTNIDPTKATASNFDPNYLLSSGQIEYANAGAGYTQLLYQSMMMQGLASTLNYYGNGDKYINTSGTIGYQGEIWSTCYTALSRLNQAITVAKTKDAALYNNVIQIARINEMMMFQRITDSYGDVPFTQALLASSGVETPSYDTQKSIYTAMLTELQTAINALTTTGTASGDLYYAGDVAQNKRMAYSLMLRIAMRLTKSDPTTAQTWAETAYKGGVMTSNTDNAILKTDASNSDTKNANTVSLQVTDDFQQVRWSQTFISFLKATNDPRLSVVAEVPVAGLANAANQSLTGDNTASLQIGMPNGYDQNGGTTDIKNAPGYPGASGTGSDAAPLGNYSRPRIAVYLQTAGPIFVISYAETQFLLAEAAYRGYAVGNSAATYYSNGVTAALNSMSQMSTASSTIASSDIATYVAANPLVAGSELKMINEQYWANDIANFSFIECWANWRRSGYPVLTPVNYTGNVTNGTIPRRMPYPNTEITTNGVNYKAAVALLSGGDLLTSRVYWDK